MKQICGLFLLVVLTGCATTGAPADEKRPIVAPEPTARSLLIPRAEDTAEAFVRFIGTGTLNIVVESEP